MYVEVEPSGCCECKGMVQVRFCMYLEEGDYGYEKHYIEVPVIDISKYPGKVDIQGLPADLEKFNKWGDKLPKEWQNTPFHNHFIQVPASMTNEEIMDIGEAFLHEAYIKWASNEKLDLVNDALAFHRQMAERTDCSAKVQEITSTALRRNVK